jgi:hypothetical protein
MNQMLDIKRMGYLARRDLLSEWRGYAVASGAVAGFMFLKVMILSLSGGMAGMDYLSFLTGTLVIWGTISASQAFTSLHDKTRNEAYLLLPASSLEKTLVRLLSVSVATPLYIIVMLSLASLFTEGVSLLLFHTPFSPLNPFQGFVLKAVGLVVILQSVFFLGAAWFKRAHYIKTVLTLVLISIFLAVISAVLFRVLFASSLSSFSIYSSPGMFHFSPDPMVDSTFPALMNTLEIIGKVLIYGFLAPFCWFAAWLRVKGTQSSDGV